MCCKSIQQSNDQLRGIRENPARRSPDTPRGGGCLITHKGAYLSDVRFKPLREGNGGGGLPPPYGLHAGRSQRSRTKSASDAGTKSLELRIRSIPVSIASKAGYLFSIGDFDESDR